MDFREKANFNKAPLSIKNMDIEIFGGKDEIGGNKILIGHKGTKIILDFGMSFNQATKYYCEFLQPRKGQGLTDFFEFNLLPDINGIYRGDYLRHNGKKKESKEVDAIFLTHAHADHAQYIHFLREDIPIYCSKETKTILKVLEETGSNPFSDFITSCESFVFYINTKGELSKIDRRKKEFIRERQFKVVKPNETINIGSLKVEMVPVDHSLPGCCAIIIYSDEGNIVYTGDIRFHGSNPELSKKFVEKAEKSKPTWFLCEGTRIDEMRIDSEEYVKKTITKLISEAKGLVFLEHPIRDLDRVKTIFDSAKEKNRKFVINTKLAYLISELGSESPFKLDDVRILIPAKEWGLVCRNNVHVAHNGKIMQNNNVKSDLIEKEYESWERQFINHKNAINCLELKKNQSKYVVSMNFWEIKNLIDIHPENAIWIKSSCEPFCDEMELDEKRKRNWLKHFGIKEFSAHASGHASGGEIRDMIKQINAKNLIPIHTEHPEMF